MTQLIHPDLSYQVRGVLLDVYNTLGPLLPERFYEDAIAIGLETCQLRVETQKEFQVHYRHQQVGLYYTDLWIEDGKIVIELKVDTAVSSLHKAQTISYLKVTNADLAILANYGAASLQDQRIPNFLRDKRPIFNWQPRPQPQDLLYPDLCQAIFRACHQVHFTLGTGFLHRVYCRATRIELRHCGLSHRYIKTVPITYQNHHIGNHQARLILVEEKILLATYALKGEQDRAIPQLRAQMRHLNIKLGLLANFYGTTLTITPVRLP